LTKDGQGNILGEFFSNSAGHPAPYVHVKLAELFTNFCSSIFTDQAGGGGRAEEGSAIPTTFQGEVILYFITTLNPGSRVARFFWVQREQAREQIFQITKKFIK
jgi:hypothetical protein